MTRRSMAMDLTALQLKMAKQQVEDLEDIHTREKRVLVEEVRYAHAHNALLVRGWCA